MRFTARASGIVRLVVLAMTLVFTAVALVVGHSDGVEPVVLEVGQPAPVTYTATREISVVDEVSTEQAREAAAAGVEDIYTEDVQATNAVLGSIQEFWVQRWNQGDHLPVPDVPMDQLTTTDDFYIDQAMSWVSAIMHQIEAKRGVSYVG